MSSITVVFEVYDRMGPGNILMRTIKASTLKDAVLEMFDHIGMYSEKADILEHIEEEGDMSVEEILDKFIGQENGDGCDFVAFVKDDETNEILFNARDGYGMDGPDPFKTIEVN